MKVIDRVEVTVRSTSRIAPLSTDIEPVPLIAWVKSSVPLAASIVPVSATLTAMTLAPVPADLISLPTTFWALTWPSPTAAYSAERSA